MVKRSLQDIVEQAKKVEKVVIVGAGNKGRELLKLLKKENVSVECFFDNHSSEKYIESIKVTKPYRIKNERVIYVISVCDINLRKKLRTQLEVLGISSVQIITYYSERDYEYMKNLSEKFYKEELSDIYMEYLGKNLNWENPKTYTEWINWEKLNDRDSKKTRLTDKFLVREWIEQQIGAQYLTKLYGVWDKVEDIDFDLLPDKFVIKTNNRSGGNIIVKEKSAINIEEMRVQLNNWLNENYAYNRSLQLHYRDIIPKIICEEYLEGVAEEVYDYNIYCFHGEPEYIWCIKGSHKPNCKASFYDKNWTMQEFSLGYPMDMVKAPRPEKLDKMLELSRILSKDFRHVRVDWYNLPDGRVIFGEMTFTTWGGLKPFEPEKYDAVFGNLIG